MREVKRVVASFGVSQSLCFRRARMAVSLLGVVENGDNNLSKVGFRGTTRPRVGEIISVLDQYRFMAKLD